MTAVADQQPGAVPPALLPPLEELTLRQQTGLDCAWCGRPLGVHARELGTVADRLGNEVPLMGCDQPPCLPRRQRGAAWPRGDKPAVFWPSPP